MTFAHARPNLRRMRERRNHICLLRFLPIVLLGAPIAIAQPTPSFVSATVGYSRVTSDVTAGISTVAANRANSAGASIELRGPQGLLRISYAHDSMSFLSMVLRTIGFDSGEFSRDRWETAAGYAASPYVDVEAGVRNERIIFGLSKPEPGMPADTEFLALMGGVAIHTPRDSVAHAELSARGYYGGTGLSRSRFADTNGSRVELKVPIRLGRGSIHVVPGFAYERLRSGHTRLNIKSRSYFVGLSYRTPVEGPTNGPH